MTTTLLDGEIQISQAKSEIYLFFCLAAKIIDKTKNSYPSIASCLFEKKKLF